MPINVMQFRGRAFAVGVKEKNPFMATYSKSLRSNRLSVSYALDEAVSNDRVFMFTCGFMSN